MERFYHFSHFLEVLTGVYFGGIALLAFLEERGSPTLSDKLEYRKDQADQAMILARQYFEVRTIAGPAGGAIKYLRNAIGFILFHLVLKGVNSVFKSAYIRVERVTNWNKQRTLQKKFFPAFVYTGIFCLSIIIISAMQESNCNSLACHIAADKFMIFYMYSSIIFLLWALIGHPRLVNKIDFIHLLFVCLFLCIILIIISIYGMNHNWFHKEIDSFLTSPNQIRLIAWVFVIALLPLIYIFIYVFLVTLSWETTVFNKLTCILFAKKDIVREIEDL